MTKSYEDAWIENGRILVRFEDESVKCIANVEDILEPIEGEPCFCGEHPVKSDEAVLAAVRNAVVKMYEHLGRSTGDTEDAVARTVLAQVLDQIDDTTERARVVEGEVVLPKHCGEASIRCREDLTPGTHVHVVIPKDPTICDDCKDDEYVIKPHQTNDWCQAHCAMIHEKKGSK